MKNIPKYPTLLILSVLLAGFLLRFWNFWEIPFTHDELSALARLQFESISELIRLGIKPDGHPAGVHVFLWYWTKLFGEQEIIVKLPFLLAGVAAVFVSYRIGSLWFSKTTGVLTAVYISSLQMMVMYSQIARPYISGLLFTLLMVLYWSKYFFQGNKIRHLVLFVIFASLATYNHHFSLLFAAIVGFSGLWFVTKKNRWLYFSSGLIIFVLYIPHLPIFFSQLNEGGIGSWLNKPGPFFLFEFFDWLFHFSPIVWIVLLGAWFFVVFARGNMHQPSNAFKKRIVLLSWFFIPFIVGYVYSVLFEPVLQYSVLIFSTPYLFTLFFSVAKNISGKRISLLVVLILLVNIGSLVWDRQYYTVFYKQPYQQIVGHAVKLESTQFEKNVFIIDDYIPFFNEYYLEKYKSHIPYYTVRNKELNVAGFRSIVDGIHENVVLTSGLKPGYFQIVKESFPYLIGQKNGFIFEQYTFSRQLPEGEKKLSDKTVTVTDFSGETGNWRINKKYIEEDSVNNSNVFHMKPGTKFGPGITMPLSEITDSRYLFIDIAVQVKALDKNSRGAIVVVIKNGEETIQWKSVNFSKFELIEGEWTNVYLTIDLLVSLGRNGNVEPCIFDTYIWNPNNNDFLIKSFKITSRPGNPYRYSLFYEIED